MRHPIPHGEPKTPAAHDPMAHDMGMGHGAEMDPHAMSHDMRNRFWIALLFTLPVLLLSPMAGLSPLVTLPPSVNTDVVLFVLASGANLFTASPFLQCTAHAS